VEVAPKTEGAFVRLGHHLALRGEAHHGLDGAEDLIARARSLSWSTLLHVKVPSLVTVVQHASRSVSVSDPRAGHA
jgi:hypothetical protein